jgi:hypothetical protein
MRATALRVRHRLYGAGWWQSLREPGHACVAFDGTADYAAGERRVLVRDLEPERAADAVVTP